MALGGGNTENIMWRKRKRQSEKISIWRAENEGAIGVMKNVHGWRIIV